MSKSEDRIKNRNKSNKHSFQNFRIKKREKQRKN